MKKIVILFVLAVMAFATNAAEPRMMYSDTTRLGRPLAKDPFVINWKDGYLMYYSIPAVKEKNLGWGIGIAESKDLVNWTRIGEITPGENAPYEAKGLCAPSAIVIDGKVNLFYQTYGNGRKDAICHAVSEDGINFVRNKTNPIFRPTGDWNCGRAIDAEIAYLRGRNYLYFATRTPDYKIQMQGVAVASRLDSFDRDVWQMACDSSILKPELPWEQKCIEGAAMIERYGRLYMFYAGAYNNAPQQIGVASSEDGVTWTRLSNEPFLANGKEGEWNSSESGHPHLFIDKKDGRTYLFYQGNNDKGKTWFLSKYEIGWKDEKPYIIK